MSVMKADAVIKQHQSAINKARSKAKEMVGRLLVNINTGATFEWTPELSIQGHMTLVSTEDQKDIEESQRVEARKKGARGPQANYGDKSAPKNLSKKITQSLIDEVKGSLTADEKAAIVAEAKAEIVAEAENQADLYDGLNLEELRAVAAESGVNVGNMTNPEKIRDKLRSAA